MGDIKDELIELNKRIENGEDVEKELESLFGKFAIKLIALKLLEC
ncbi:hypothetical protein [Clostridium niameyense]|nr:hypothetical protein [Clostridium niameyense]